MPAGHAAGTQAGMQAGIKAWHDGIDWWTRQVHGNRSEVNDVVERFN